MTIPPDWIQTAKEWQTLIASSIAILAALIAWFNTSRTLKANAKLETKRRTQKFNSLRAVLPLSLSEISAYCVSSAHTLENLWGQCVENSLPKNADISPDFPIMPTETVNVFAEFIEYADSLDAALFQKLLERLQVFRSRIRDIARVLERDDNNEIVLAINIEEYVLDAAAIYACAAAAFDFGRHKTDVLPRNVTWDQVRSALRNMKLWDQDIPEAYETITRRETDGLEP